MKTSQRKKIIIGYRYDPQSYTSQRLQQVQTTQNFNENQYLPVDSVKKTFETDQILIQKLKNQNSLLKAQLHRLESKTSFKSYQLLQQLYNELQNQCNKLKKEVQQLNNTIKSLKQRQKELQYKSYTQATQIIQQQTDSRDGRKYTFSPYNNLINTQNDISQQGKFSQQKSKSIQTYRNTTTDESIQHKFLDTLNKESQNFHNIELNNLQQNQERQNDTIQKNTTPNPNQYKFFNKIDTQYLYNDLRTIQSEKSQQFQSQIHLGYNFSFMPKPLTKNIKTLQALDDQNDKKTSFKQQANIAFTSSHKQMVKKDAQPAYFSDSCQQSLCVSQNNQSQPNIIGKLNGLRKLPNKPLRNQHTTSNNSISISQRNN